MDDVIENAAKSVFKNNTTAQGAFVYLANALGEGFEEFATEYADALANRLIVGTDERKFRELTEDALYSGLVGALVSGVIQGGQLAAGSIPTAQELADATVEQMENAAPEGGEESTSVNDDPAVHTAEEQAQIEAYKAAVDEKIVSAVKRHIENPRKFQRQIISDVSDRQANDTADILGGDYHGFTNAINSNGIQHIIIRHGENGTADHSMADVNDIARVGYVLSNYDTVERGVNESGYPEYSAEFRDKNNAPSPVLVFSKKVNGTYYVVEAVADNAHKKMWVISAYMDNKGAVTQAPDVKSPGSTPETPLASPTPITDYHGNSKSVNPLAQTALNGMDARRADESAGAAPGGMDQADIYGRSVGAAMPLRGRPRQVCRQSRFRCC